jgi:hypothetical protein
VFVVHRNRYEVLSPGEADDITIVSCARLHIFFAVVIRCFPTFFCLLVCLVFAVLGVEPKASSMLAKHSTIKDNPSPFAHFLALLGIKPSALHTLKHFTTEPHPHPELFVFITELY